MKTSECANPVGHAAHSFFTGSADDARLLRRDDMTVPPPPPPPPRTERNHGQSPLSASRLASSSGLETRKLSFSHRPEKPAARPVAGFRVLRRVLSSAMLCLSLFLSLAGAEESQASQQASCVSNDLMAYVDGRIPTAATDRWVRIKNALTEQPNAMALSEAKQILANRQAQNLGLEHMDEVVAAIECLAKPEPETVDADDVPVACVSPQLQADVKGYSEETWRESPDHVERWLRVLQTFSGTANDSTVMTPAEAQTYADRGLPRWVPVLAALQCLEAEALNAQVEVEDETTPEPQQDAGVPVDTNPDPAPDWPTAPASTDGQDQTPAGFTNFRAYIHDPTPNPDPGTEYRISEDDHWEAELIIHVESNEITSLNAVNSVLCINHDIWSGNDYWNNGPISLPGFNNYLDRKSSPTWDSLKGVSKQYGYWQCTDNIGADPTPPNITISNPADDGDDGNTSNDDGIVEFIYRAKIRTRDNNVVEDDFRVSDLEFRYALSLTGKTIWLTETEDEVDRSWWRMLENEVAWVGSWALGTGSEWVDFTNPTCSQVAPSKFIDRAPADRDKNHSDYIVRADVSEDTWLPDHCFPTKQVPKIPPTPPNSQPTTFDNTSLPIIEEDDVSYVKLHKVNGKWTVSLSKPVMVTDGKDCSAEEAEQQAQLDQLIANEPDARRHNGIRNNFNWSFDLECDKWWKTDTGILLEIELYSTINGRLLTGDVGVLIPATNGIVQATDYVLNDLNIVGSSEIGAKRSNPSNTVRVVSSFSEACQGVFAGIPRLYRDAYISAVIPRSRVPIDAPPENADMCR